jgi:hypothetical protein
MRERGSGSFIGRAIRILTSILPLFLYFTRSTLPHVPYSHPALRPRFTLDSPDSPSLIQHYFIYIDQLQLNIIINWLGVVARIYSDRERSCRSVHVHEYHFPYQSSYLSFRSITNRISHFLLDMHTII